MTRAKRVILLVVISAIVVGGAVLGCCCWSAEKTCPQPDSRSWAQRIDKPGLGNLHRVSDTLYRGEQPTAEGMKQLKAMGIKTVVNLRQHHSDDEILSGVDLACENLPTSAFEITADEVVAFLRIATDPARQPVFVHCKHGADRTGVMCAAYRMVVQGWTRDEALEEMTEGGFGHSRVWFNLRRFVERMDVADIRLRTGLD